MGLNIGVFEPVFHKRGKETNGVPIDLETEKDSITDKFMEYFGKYIYRAKVGMLHLGKLLKKHYGIRIGEHVEITGFGGGGVNYMSVHVKFHKLGRTEYFKIYDKWRVVEIHRRIDVIEVSDQRKGANQQFYEDDMWSHPYICDQETLEKHYKEYFSHNTPESKGGWASGTEYELTDEEMSSQFKEYIMDNFSEGKNFVIYH